MSTGQMLLTILAFALLAKLTLSLNTVEIDGEAVGRLNEATITASALAQSMMNRILQRGYDDKFWGGTATSSSAFRPQMGPDPGETAGNDTTYNDVDDYDKYTATIHTPRLGDFRISCAVTYVSMTAPYAAAASKSYMKRIDVRVTNNYLTSTADAGAAPDTVTLSRYVCYR